MCSEGPPEIRYAWEEFALISGQAKAAKSAQKDASLTERLDNKKKAVFGELLPKLKGDLPLKSGMACFSNKHI